MHQQTLLSCPCGSHNFSTSNWCSHSMWLLMRKDRSSPWSRLAPRMFGVPRACSGVCYLLPCILRLPFSMNVQTRLDPVSSWLFGRDHQTSLDVLITHKYRGSQQFSRVEYSTQIYWFDTRGAKEYLQVLAVELSIQPHRRVNICSRVISSTVVW